MATNKNALLRLKFLDELLSSKSLSKEELYNAVNYKIKTFCSDNSLDYNKHKIEKRCIEKDIYWLENESPWKNEGFDPDDDSGDDEVDAPSLIRRVWDVRPNPNPELENKWITVKLLSYRRKGFSIFQPKISSTEKHLLQVALSFIGQFDGISSLKGLNQLQKQFNADKSNKYISVSSNYGVDGRSIFADLYVAIEQHTVIRLYYHRIDEQPEARNILFHPYHLHHYNGLWYVIGAADSDHYMLTFALDRLDKIEYVEDVKFYQPHDFDINDWYEDILGVTVLNDNQIQEVLFWANDLCAYYVRIRPLHGSQRERRKDDAELREQYPHLEGGAFFTIDVKKNSELIGKLMSYGAGLVVLSPNDIVDEVKSRIVNMHNMYFK